ncbi:hypothetical protein SAMN05421693_10924 [Ectothiorhodospira magna]|uniref:DUF2058 family protein n=1 Tax=Ectothiorhodospira magna TaxID=867345 RepID=A0A1H9BI17_9GAMM|nr:DUF2058 family protein [Ectothiorhodospira magna]SEP88371.1 hypothetical protein SAMN05421693_10924 [Ectothiorhodospira magna]
MTQSLREQMLQAGLVTEEQVKQVEQAKTSGNRPGERRAPRKGKSGQPGKSGTQDRGRRQGRRPSTASKPAPAPRPPATPSAEARALKQQLRQLVAAHRLNSETADLPYHFQVGKTIKHLYVTAQQQADLAAGRLCIAFLDGRRNLLPVEQGQAILRLDPSRTVIFPGHDAPDPSSGP